jgi:hypothetical protein
VRPGAPAALTALALAFTTVAVPALADAPSPAADGAPALAVTPRLLLQSDTVLAHHGASLPAIEDGTTRPGFYLRRARIGLDASDGGPWRARLIVEATARSEVADTALDAIAGEIDRGKTRPTQAYVAFAPHKAFMLSSGALRVPIGLSRQIDEADLRLPERARIITRATPDFRMGVSASGDLGLMQYALGGYSVAPTFGSDFRDGGVLTVLHLAAEPLGPMGVAPQLRRRDDPWYRWWRFSAGLSAFYAALPGADELGVGGDGQFQWARLLVTGELLWTRRASADRVGFTVEPGLFVVPERLELVARLEWLNDEVGPVSPVDGWGGALGATFYSASRHARLQAACTLRRAAAGEPGIDRAAAWAVVRATFTY